MRLLNTRTGELKDMNGSSPAYAILSHVWAKEGEQTFQDVSGFQSHDRTERSGNYAHPSASYSRLSPKIRGSCKFAAQLGLSWIWIDTCCIDKTSSAELSEAINSMFAWYRDAAVCIAYLADVPHTTPLDDCMAKFQSSTWFTRGWTLQELVAPKHVIFASASWKPFGSKASLGKAIEGITGIPSSILLSQKSLSDFSIAQRMSWAAKRQTTRVEDRAYALMGLFGVHIPTIYGEGRAAFRRLQEEIVKRSSDPTLFAWNIVPTPSASHPQEDITKPGMLAEDPADFEECASITRVSMKDMNRAVRAVLDVMKCDFDRMRREERTASAAGRILQNLRSPNEVAFPSTFSLEPRVPTFTMDSHAILAYLPLITIDYSSARQLPANGTSPPMLQTETAFSTRVDAIALLPCGRMKRGQLSPDSYIGLPLQYLDLGVATTPPVYVTTPIEVDTNKQRLVFSNHDSTQSSQSTWTRTLYYCPSGRLLRVSVDWAQVYISHTSGSDLDHPSRNITVGDGMSVVPEVPLWVRLKVLQNWRFRTHRSTISAQMVASCVRAPSTSVGTENIHGKADGTGEMFHVCVYPLKDVGYVEYANVRVGVKFGKQPDGLSSLGEYTVPLASWKNPWRDFDDGKRCVRLTIAPWNSIGSEIDIEVLRWPGIIV